MKRLMGQIQQLQVKFNDKAKSENQDENQRHLQVALMEWVHWHIFSKRNSFWFRSSSRWLEDVSRQMDLIHSQNGLRRFTEVGKEAMKVSELMSDIRDAVLDYQVCNIDLWDLSFLSQTALGVSTDVHMPAEWQTNCGFHTHQHLNGLILTLSLRP